MDQLPRELAAAYTNLSNALPLLSVRADPYLPILPTMWMPTSETNRWQWSRCKNSVANRPSDSKPTNKTLLAELALLLQLFSSGDHALLWNLEALACSLIPWMRNANLNLGQAATIEPTFCWDWCNPTFATSFSHSGHHPSIDNILNLSTTHYDNAVKISLRLTTHHLHRASTMPFHLLTSRKHLSTERTHRRFEQIQEKL